MIAHTMRPGKRRMVALAAVLAVPALASPSAGDATATALDRCLNDAAKGSTAGQTECEIAARGAYDRRLNAAYTALMRTLPSDAAGKLRQSQRAWLAYRNGEQAAQGALFATRQGTMFVPMQADAATTLTRDRALLLESYVRIMAID